ncbi:hypothetical protein [Geofilum rubicundum]|uniref:Uncharacterized protein n=1 Tax=Geofilum rubicundum JCM 15548 TaxID=1236989 RepID=A0A0E9LWM5_9BACT|nr:hypothetical protein [Geofilum rubicundum]GAO29654.1 hypothetical protein JCM15548_11866 [Geofilum rubicundum JCM 15548]
MNTMIKIYLKLFLRFALIFGLLIFLFDFLLDGKVEYVQKSITTLLFAAFMAWFSVRSARKRKLEIVGGELTEADFVVSKSESVPKHHTIQEVYELLKTHDTTRKWKFKLSDSGIVGKTKLSWSSWGERIFIRDLDDKLVIESKPIFITTIVDNGKNHENVQLIKEVIAQ